MANIKFIPSIIGDEYKQEKQSKDIISSTTWNNLFELNRKQGNDNTNYLYAVANYLFDNTVGFDNTVTNFLGTTSSTLTTHVANTNNPHSVIASQVNNTALTTIAGTNVQTVLGNMDTAISLRETISHAQSTYEPISTANSLIKNVILNPTPGVHNGVLRFIKQDDTYFDIDTNLEKVVTNFTYDSTTKKLKLIYPDGTFVEISLADLVDDYTFTDTSTIDFTLTNHNVTASVKDHSITATQIDSQYMDTINGQVAIATQQAGSASTSASNANNYKEASQTYSYDSEAWSKGTRNNIPVTEQQAGYNDNSKYYKEQAAIQATAASEYADNASDSATEASGYATTANTKAGEASDSATSANTNALKSEGYAIGKQNGTDVSSGSPYYHNNAKYWCDQAAVIVGGTYVTSVNNITPGDVSGPITIDPDDLDDTDTTNKFVTTSEKSIWNGKQDVLTAGSNIQINGTTISATDTIYTLPTASDSTKGGVKIGSNLTMNGEVLSATDTTYTAGTNISITDNVIAVSKTIPTFTYDSSTQTLTITT